MPKVLVEKARQEPTRKFSTSHASSRESNNQQQLQASTELDTRGTLQDQRGGEALCLLSPSCVEGVVPRVLSEINQATQGINGTYAEHKY